MNILQIARLTSEVLRDWLADKYIKQEEVQEAIVQIEPKDVVEMSFEAGMDVEMTFILEV